MRRQTVRGGRRPAAADRQAGKAARADQKSTLRRQQPSAATGRPRDDGAAARSALSPEARCRLRRRAWRAADGRMRSVCWLWRGERCAASQRNVLSQLAHVSLASWHCNRRQNMRRRPGNAHHRTTRNPVATWKALLKSTRASSGMYAPPCPSPRPSLNATGTRLHPGAQLLPKPSPAHSPTPLTYLTSMLLTPTSALLTTPPLPRLPDYHVHLPRLGSFAVSRTSRTPSVHRTLLGSPTPSVYSTLRFSRVSSG